MISENKSVDVKFRNYTGTENTVTDKIQSLEINKNVGEIFNTCEIRGKLNIISDKDIKNENVFFTVTINNKSEKYYIYDATKNEKDIYTIYCRSNGGLLDEPFSPSENLSESSDAVDIINSYCSDKGITTNITNFDVKANGGVFEIEGTRADMIKELANIQLADIYNKNDALYIEEKKTIQNQTPVSKIYSNRIIEVLNNSSEIGKGKVKKILINPDIFIKKVESEPKINLEIDEGKVSNNLFVYFNPMPNSDDEIWCEGVHLGLLETIVKRDVINVSNTRIVRLTGAIADNSITVKGTDRHFTYFVGHNILLFDEDIDANIEVTYNTKVKRGSVNLYAFTRSPLYLKVRYLNQVLDWKFTKVYKFSNEPASGGDFDNSDELEDSNDNVDGVGENIRYNPKAPFVVYDGGIIPKGSATDIKVVFYSEDDADLVIDFLDEKEASGILYSYYYDNPVYHEIYVKSSEGHTISDFGKFAKNVSLNVTDYYHKDLARIIKNGSDYIAYMSMKAKNGSYVKVAINGRYLTSGTDFEYVSNAGEDDYIKILNDSFKTEGKQIEIAYQPFAVNINIPAVGTNSVVKYIKISSPSFLDFYWYGLFEKSDECVYPMSINVPVAELLNISTEEAFGKTVLFETENKTVDEAGKVNITIAEAGVYFLDTGNIISNSVIQIKAK